MARWPHPMGPPRRRTPGFGPLALALAAALTAPLPALAQAGPMTAKQRQILIARALRGNCERLTRNDEDAEKCVQDQLSAGQDFKQLAESIPPGTAEREFVAECFERWVRPSLRRVDFRMALQCLEFEVEAQQSRQ